MYKKIALIFMCLWYMSYLFSWTKTYVTHPNFLTNARISKTRIEWYKRAIPAFSQLIFSWHALRPKKGTFTFWVQVRNRKTKQWYAWHKVAIWGTDKAGNTIQRSFANKSTHGTSFHYVRLEVPQANGADGFKVRVDATQGADLRAIKRLIVNASSAKDFTSEIGTDYLDRLTSVTLAKLPKYSQMKLDHPKSDSLCSPTSVSMVLGFLLKKEIDPVAIAKGVFDYGLEIYGSWPFNVAYAYEVSAQQVGLCVERLSSFKYVYNALKKQQPVIVSVRGPLAGGATPYANGHLLVIVGYDQMKQKVICHDPAFSSNDDVLVMYNCNDFIRAWERSYRLAYTIFC